MDQIYMKPDEFRRILGIQGYSLQNPKSAGKMLKKDYMFRWMGSTMSMNIHIKSQQAINFIGMASAIPPNPEFKIGFPYLLKEAWRNLGNVDVDKVVIETGKMVEYNPKQENEIMLNGKLVEIHPNNDDKAHIAAHDFASKSVTDDAIGFIFVQHIQAHLAAAKMKFLQQQMEQMQAQMAQQAQMMGQPLPMMPGNGTAPQGPQRPSGNPNQPNMPKPPNTTQAGTFGDVAASTIGGGAPRPPKGPNQVPGMGR
jgi:hypothetical protein